MKRIIVILLALVMVVPLVAQESQKANEGFKKGYRGIVEFGGLFLKNYGSVGNLVSIINGYQFNPYLVIGIGTGLYYDFKPDLYTRMLVSLDLRMNILNKRTSPYISFGAEYLPKIQHLQYFDLFLRPQVGINHNLRNNLYFHVGIGYCFTAGIYDEGTVTDHLLSCNAGLSFQLK